MIKDKNYKEMIKQMRSGASRLEREGEYWTPEEREDLKRIKQQKAEKLSKRQNMEDSQSVCYYIHIRKRRS